ncbi:alpha/beta fold hydrolase [Streptococcus oralis]|uniref:3-oxoadipate enol-lactone hydrolase/4-carboxymuconolactone decarboxylase n=1 Tax=Streptococcus oralis TaxID=1303 RepID=A0A139P1Y1_STROR|nr:alpha/beta hydrolase [Streptococcus oralis]KXT82291.1 3-oxoadipate enol-lactone hydrolase/4-carboxymuconolactone decarboxylase [Streptococcus oralis]
MSSTKWKTLHFNEKSMDYVTFGKGKDPLVIIPGLGDGLQTVKGIAIPLSIIYRILAERYKVYVFSRINKLPENYTTRNMAADVAEAMDVLNLKSSVVMGISQGGMIAQWVAVDFPEKVESLILAVTTAKLSELGMERIRRWLSLSQIGTYKELMVDIASHSYTTKSFGKFKYLYRIMGIFGRIKDKQRIAIQAVSCLKHDSLTILEKINCSTLIIGAEKDDVLGVEASLELHQHIKDSQLTILPECGHALYEQNKDFQKRVLVFLES